MYRRIRELREDSDITQAAIAKELQCSQQVYSNYELGQRMIPPETLIALAKIHNTSVDYLLGLTVVVYFIPSIFIEKAKDTLASGIMGFYKPCLWLSEVLGGSVQSPVVISAGLTAFLCLILYKLSGDRYLSKHPELADKI